MRFYLFIILVLLLPDLLWWWWADRRLRGRPRLRLALAAFMVLMAGQIVWMLVWPETARRAHHVLPLWWMIALYLWHLLVLPLSGLMALLNGGLRLALRRPPPRPTDPGRRRLLAACAALAPPVATGIGTVLALPQLERFRLRRIQLALPGLPGALDGTRIAHVSDLHYGKYTRPNMIEDLVATVNGLDSDLILFTGDLIDLSLVDLDPAVETLRRLEARSGLYLCEGNHDLIDDGEEFRARMRDAGLGLLVDESAVAEVRGRPVELLGTRWRRSDKERANSARRLIARRSDEAFPILLAHHPHSFDFAENVPLTLSGHTHGGLLMLSEKLGPGPVLYRYWSGSYRKDERSLVVSNGVGTWFPIRTHAPAEVIEVTLRGA